jgi:hypothetical protein
METLARCVGPKSEHVKMSFGHVLWTGKSIVYPFMFYVSSARIDRIWSNRMKEAPLDFIHNCSSLFVHIFYPFFSFRRLVQRYSSAAL